jgi:hypothetical protein
MKRLNFFFESIVEVPRIKHGNKQTVETLVNEEAFLLAQYLRSEKPTWNPRIVNLLSTHGSLNSKRNERVMSGV